MSQITMSTVPDTVQGYDGGRSSSRWRALTDPASQLPVYAGVLVVIVGFVLMGITWAAVAGEVDVYRQLPYLASIGLPGLGLVMVGLITVNVGVRRQDGAERARQLGTLTEALRDLQRSIGD